MTTLKDEFTANEMLDQELTTEEHYQDLTSELAEQLKLCFLWSPWSLVSCWPNLTRA